MSITGFAATDVTSAHGRSADGKRMSPMEKFRYEKSQQNAPRVLELRAEHLYLLTETEELKYLLQASISLTTIIMRESLFSVAVLSATAIAKIAVIVVQVNIFSSKNSFTVLVVKASDFNNAVELYIIIMPVMTSLWWPCAGIDLLGWLLALSFYLFIIV